MVRLKTDNHLSFSDLLYFSELFNRSHLIHNARMRSAPVRVCLNSVDVPVVHSAPFLIDSARSIRAM
jgi:hypothetical protein